MREGKGHKGKRTMGKELKLLEVQEQNKNY